jgi:nitronate monooxygenase
LAQAKHAIDAGAEIIVAQGAEAGGHGLSRATMTLVPEIADFIAKFAQNVLLCAAGGIADGRGLAASLMLGADGVLVGSRFWASNEALVQPKMMLAAMAASGDDTIRSTVMDIARSRNWPAGFTARVLQNGFTEQWHDDPDTLKDTPSAHVEWAKAWAEGNPEIANTFVGEGVGLINDQSPAAQIIAEMVAQAKACLKGQNFNII